MRATLSLLCLLTLTVCLQADHKARGRSAWAWAAASSNSSESPNSSVVKQSLTPAPTVKQSLPVAGTTSTGSDDALDEVNAYRVKRGLPPFKHDAQLTIAAKRAAETRAKALWDGHLSNDFACLPAGATADAAGCGALEDSWGWGTCCMDDNYSHAGAAWVRGSDNRRYMHLFVRNGDSGTQAAKSEPPTIIPQATYTGETVGTAGTCTTGSCGVSQVQQSFSRRRR